MTVGEILTAMNDVSPRSIRLRILKDLGGRITDGKTRCFTTLDPLEDTESFTPMQGRVSSLLFHHARSA